MRTDLPSGTVTFLFTDVEGSTQQVQRSGEEDASVLAAQRKILRATFDKFHGHEVDTQGDSFFVVFARAADAIAASVEARCQSAARHRSMYQSAARTASSGGWSARALVIACTRLPRCGGAGRSSIR